MKWYILIKNCNNSFFCQIYCEVFLFASFKFSLSLKNAWKYLWKIICLWTNAIKNDYNLLGELLVVILRDGSPFWDPGVVSRVRGNGAMKVFKHSLKLWSLPRSHFCVTILKTAASETRSRAVPPEVNLLDIQVVSDPCWGTNGFAEDLLFLPPPAPCVGKFSRQAG